MSELHMIELRPDVVALLRFAHSQGLAPVGDDGDLGYAVHAWMAAAFGKSAPRPWRLLADQRRPPRILGYARCGALALRQRLHEFAEPGVFAVCSDPDAEIASRPMPTWNAGRRLGFEVLCCPVGRKSRSGMEKDLFLIRADVDEEGSLSRDAVYCDWTREQLQRYEGAHVNAIRLGGFRLVRQVRRPRESRGGRGQSRLVRPQALLQGELTVADPEAFASLLSRGVGRHRAFGYGMLLLRPPS